MPRQLSRLFQRAPKSRLTPLALSIEHSIEEQTLPHYSPLCFLPVSIGDVVNEHYEIITKLGYGSDSTVWLAKDIRWCVFLMQFGFRDG